MTGQPDLRAAARALDDVIAMAALANSTLEDALKAAIQARDALLGEPALDLAAAQASPYGSAKHGVYDALSAAAVAQDVEPRLDPLCRGGDHAGCVGPPGTTCECPCHWRTGHLPQHTHGEGPCTHEGCHDAGHDLPARTREVPADVLAAHAPWGAQ